MCYKYEVGFMHVCDKCHSLSFDIFNANMTLFEMSLLRQLDINQYISVFVMTTLLHIHNMSWL